MSVELKTSEEWAKLYEHEFTIIDPKGWDKASLDYSFKTELITRSEFMRRVFHSWTEMQGKAIYL